MPDAINQQTLSCHVKWFDPKKGYGFLIPDEGGPDILLHANVLRNAGRGSIADGVRLEAVVGQDGERWQAIAVTTIHAVEGPSLPHLLQVKNIDPDILRLLPYLAARVKWFDLAKGFGFATVFGSDEDVFIHLEVLRASALGNLEAGEAVAIKVIDGERGRMAVEVAEWQSAPTDSGTHTVCSSVRFPKSETIQNLPQQR
jgi:CspA family cold shock protein